MLLSDWFYIGIMFGFILCGGLVCLIDRLRYPELPRCRCLICEPERKPGDGN